MGVRGGSDGGCAYAAKIETDGTEVLLPPTSVEEVVVGEWVVGVTSGGGGYGHPHERRPQAVLDDVKEGWVSQEHAASVYGVAVVRSADGDWTIDAEATSALRC
jgi:N-methylhydantoinase B